MSLDYPLYEELKRLGHRAAKWWRIGDTLYYLGLISAPLFAVASVALFVACLMSSLSWAYLGWSLVGVAVGIVVHIGGRIIKGHSYTLAEKDGIDVYKW